MMIFAYRTLTGSRHMVDRKRRLYWREPDAEVAGSAPLRQDFTKLPYLEATSPEVGEDLVVVLCGVAEGVVTVRRTSSVVAIEAL